MMKKGRSILFAVVLIGVGFYIGRYGVSDNQTGTGLSVLLPSDKSSSEAHVYTVPFQEAWDTLHEQFIGTLDDKKLDYGAIQGMVRAAGDPYTSFSEPESAKQFKETLSGSFSGIGADMGIQNGMITVIAPLDGSPAQKAGVKAQDVVVAVDEKNITQDMSLDDVIQQIRGPKGQTVVLTVIHKGDREPVDISIVRDDISVPSVEMDIKNGIAHISVSSFNGDTADKFTVIAKDARKQNVKGIILDLRDNPGGYLQAAVDIASHFVQPGTVVVSEKGKKESSHRAGRGGVLQGIPVVVLVNHGSASASEILAGAIGDTLKAPIIGVKSFGKGSVQDVVDLSDGSSLKVTIAKWYTPSGKSIDKEGITPTIIVEDDEKTEQDEQLDKAFQELQK